ncbi:MAG: hypothetical protein IJP32_02635 [Clostridia bacterium]|nr:hypothetical protein [Clostridia bacterium]
MLPFTAVRVEKMSLPVNGILVVRNVGVRCLGYFRPVKAEDVPDSTALDALTYGLTTAQFRLSCIPDDLVELFTTRQADMIAEANAALERSESPVRLGDVVFGYADVCIHDGSYGDHTALQRLCDRAKIDPSGLRPQTKGNPRRVAVRLRRIQCARRML